MVGRDIEVSSEEPSVERLTRAQPLQAGQYWKAVTAIPEEAITEGMVLLITSIRWAHDAPHTIILRPHPSHYDQQVQVERGADSDKRRHWIRLKEHRFLLDDFLSRFVPELDAEAIREREIKDAQQKIFDLQQELLDGQRDPLVLAAVVESELAKQKPKSEPATAGASGSKAVAVSPASSHELKRVATGTLAETLQSGITPEKIEALKIAAEREHQVATIRANWVKDRTEKIGQAVTAMTPYFQEQAAAALARTEDVRSYVARMMTGIETLDLYVGKNVSVRLIRDGESAPRDVPLTFVQRKLLMDEELSVYLDVDHEFDVSRQEEFFRALCEHDGLVEQIFPTERCVLVMATTRRHIDYSHPLISAAMNEANAEVFMLVRDGMRIHRVVSPVESHLATARLFPNTDDHKAIFRGFDGSNMKIDDVAYTDKLAVHEAQVLHYKRFLILACGLDHREKLFGDFYDGPPSFEFVSLGFQEKHCRFLFDDSGLLLAEGRPPVREWIKEKNAYLRSGSRVLVSWYGIMTDRTAPGACFPSRSDRGFEIRYRPDRPVEAVIAYRDGAELYANADVTGYSRLGDDRSFQAKVRLTKDEKPWDHEQLGYLCLDAVTESDLAFYLNSRASRSSDHLLYIRFFKHAIRFIRAEAAAEADTRRRLVEALAEGNIATGAEAEGLVSRAVIAWRAAQRGAPLPVFEDGTPPPAWKSLLDQMFMLANEGDSRTVQAEAFVRALGLAPLRLVLSGNAKLVIYAAPAESERDDRLVPHRWVHRITLELGKTKLIEKARSWSVLTARTAAETVIHQWPDAESWTGHPDVFATFHQKAQFLAPAEGCFDVIRRLGKPSSLWFEHYYKAWSLERTNLTRKLSRVVEPDFVLPIGISGAVGDLRYTCLVLRHPVELIHHLAPTDEDRARVRAAYLSLYKNRDAAAERFENAINRPAPRWEVAEIYPTAQKALEGEFGFTTHWPVAERVDYDPMLGPWLKRSLAARGKHHYAWLADGLDANPDMIDEALGITRPADWEPMMASTVSINSNSKTIATFIEIYPTSGETRTISIFSRNSWLDEAKAGFPGANGVQAHSATFATRSEAHAFVRRSTASDVAIIPASERPDLPQATKGAERWYLGEPVAQ